jgi:hypothetical protein
MIVEDLQSSDRIAATGLICILCDMVKLSFAGELCQPPPSTRILFEQLVAPEHAVCFLTIKGVQVVHM